MSLNAQFTYRRIGDSTSILNYGDKNGSKKLTTLTADFRLEYERRAGRVPAKSYYKPNSQEARLCAESFCRQHATSLWPPNENHPLIWPVAKDIILDHVTNIIQCQAYNSKDAREQKGNAREESVPTSNTRFISRYIASLDPKKDPGPIAEFTREWLSKGASPWPRAADNTIHRYMHNCDLYPFTEEDPTWNLVTPLMILLREGTDIETCGNAAALTFDSRVCNRIRDITTKLYDKGIIEVLDGNYRKTDRFESHWNDQQKNWNMVRTSTRRRKPRLLSPPFEPRMQQKQFSRQNASARVSRQTRKSQELSDLDDASFSSSALEGPLFPNLSASLVPEIAVAEPRSQSRLEETRSGLGANGDQEDEIQEGGVSVQEMQDTMKFLLEPHREIDQTLRTSSLPPNGIVTHLATTAAAALIASESIPASASHLSIQASKRPRPPSSGTRLLNPNQPQTRRKILRRPGGSIGLSYTLLRTNRTRLDTQRMKTNFQQGPYNCPHCSKTFPRPDSLARHRRTHYQIAGFNGPYDSFSGEGSCDEESHLISPASIPDAVQAHSKTQSTYGNTISVIHESDGIQPHVSPYRQDAMTPQEAPGRESAGSRNVHIEPGSISHGTIPSNAHAAEAAQNADQDSPYTLVTPSNEEGFRFKFSEAKPTPLGEDDDVWDDIFSAADHRIYSIALGNPNESKRQRESGATRKLALEMLQEKKRRDVEKKAEVQESYREVEGIAQPGTVLHAVSDSLSALPGDRPGTCKRTEAPPTLPQTVPPPKRQRHIPGGPGEAGGYAEGTGTEIPIGNEGPAGSNFMAGDVRSQRESLSADPQLSPIQHSLSDVSDRPDAETRGCSDLAIFGAAVVSPLATPHSSATSPCPVLGNAQRSLDASNNSLMRPLRSTPYRLTGQVLHDAVLIPLESTDDSPQNLQRDLVRTPAAHTSGTGPEVNLILQMANGLLNFKDFLLWREFKNLSVSEFFTLYSEKSGVALYLLTSLEFHVQFGYPFDSIDVVRRYDGEQWGKFKGRLEYLFNSKRSADPACILFDVLVRR